MKTLTRITLGHIDSLVNPNEVVEIGFGKAEGSRWRPNFLKLKTPEETRRINTPKKIMECSNGTFLSYIDKILNESNLFFADVEYRADRAGGFYPHKLSGRVYREKTE